MRGKVAKRLRRKTENQTVGMNSGRTHEVYSNLKTAYYGEKRGKK